MTKLIFSAKSACLAAVAAMGLSACGGSGTPVTEPVIDPALKAFQTLGASGESLQAEVLGLPGTAFTAIPDTGSATFRGLGSIGMVLDPDTNFEAMGTATVTVNFETQAVTGGLTNLQGIIGTAAEIAAPSDADALTAVAGSIALSGGDIYELRPNRFGVDYGGTLTVGGTDYVVAGDALGEFRGTRANPANGYPIRAVTVRDDAGVATVGTGALATTFPVEIGLYGTTE